MLKWIAIVLVLVGQYGWACAFFCLNELVRD
jgi:hypothetical protein